MQVLLPQEVETTTSLAGCKKRIQQFCGGGGGGGGGELYAQLFVPVITRTLQAQPIPPCQLMGVEALDGLLLHFPLERLLGHCGKQVLDSAGLIPLEV